MYLLELAQPNDMAVWKDVLSALSLKYMQYVNQFSKLQKNIYYDSESKHLNT